MQIYSFETLPPKMFKFLHCYIPLKLNLNGKHKIIYPCVFDFYLEFQI